MNAAKVPAILDAPTIDAMLREEGVAGTGMDYNLHRYLGRQVGIHGQSRTSSQLQSPHLTAHHIKVLDRKLR